MNHDNRKIDNSAPLAALDLRAGIATASDLDRFAREAEAAGARVHPCASGRVREVLLAVLEAQPQDAAVLFESRTLLKFAGWEIGARQMSGCRMGDLRRDAPVATREFDMAAVAVGVTGVDFALADTGTLVLKTSEQRGRLLSLLPPVHVAIVETGQVLPDLGSFLAQPPDDCSAVTLITGPSKTADIELTLVTGVHGPGELHIILVSGGESE